MINWKLPHTPPYHCMTALYHSRVYGIKKNPKIGQSAVWNTPTNHVLNAHRQNVTKRGKKSAIIATIVE
jgi:uncharacterized protein (UPF0371 family)